MHRPGAHCFVVAKKRVTSRGAKGAGHPRWNGVNGQPEELLGSGGRRQPSFGWHEPDESRGSRPDLWEARGAIPRAYPATGNRIKPNRTEGTRAKARSHTHRETIVTAPVLDSTLRTLWQVRRRTAAGSSRLFSAGVLAIWGFGLSR